MCGITGVFALSPKGIPYLRLVENALSKLRKRGPDAQGIFTNQHCSLGHTRLSIIDTSTNGNQPMTDVSGRYTIVFNGEIFNYNELKSEFLPESNLISSTDTEVLLYLFIILGEKVLPLLNGFFAFAIYDSVENSLFVAKDRYGEKPLSYYFDADVFIFGSEIKALNEYNYSKKLNYNTLFQYIQLNYVAAPHAMLQNIQKLEAGHFLKISHNAFTCQRWYSINNQISDIHKKDELSYSNAQNTLLGLLDQAVKRRLVSDVPLGAFLSGGIDSSIIVALASKYVKNLNTFSIGYTDEPFYDETHYANLVAKKYNTNHHVFKLSNQELFDGLFPMLDYLDEPFADSSALAVYILSKETRKHVTVALSGDGADELFAGYHKHHGEFTTTHADIFAKTIAALLPLWNILPKSRHSKLGNLFRQLHKFAQGMQLSAKERYWRFCAITTENDAFELLNSSSQTQIDFKTYQTDFEHLIKHASAKNNLGINNTLLNDVNLVLQNDMLPKVDLMSMANSLEVRSPFMDYKVVEFAFSIPENYKINHRYKKRILQDTFRSLLPTQLYQRPKKGFEVPLLKWMQGDLKPYLMEILNDDFIIAQNIFDLNAIQTLKKRLNSNNPEDVQGQLWALLVFQYWWKKNFNEIKN